MWGALPPRPRCSSAAPGGGTWTGCRRSRTRPATPRSPSCRGSSTRGSRPDPATPACSSCGPSSPGSGPTSWRGSPTSRPRSTCCPEPTTTRRRPRSRACSGGAASRGSRHGSGGPRWRTSRVATGGADDAALFASRGRAYEGLGDWEAAAADWQRAASQDPAGARGLAAFADRASASGRPDLAVAPYDAAQRWYEEALGSGTGNAYVARELSELLVRRSTEPKWTVLRPEEMGSTGGAQLVALPDGSVLVRGGDPQRDVCSVVFAPEAGPIRAVRLEALPDPSLPSSGPSRGGGTFDVEFELRSGNAQVAFLHGVATHANEGLAHLQRASGAAMRWLSRDEYGRGAIALCAVEADPAAGERLRVEVRSGPHPGANLGRFRLSVADANGALDREKWRLAASRLTRPWAKLAAAYRCLGDEAALDRIAARGPDAAAQVGDLFLADRAWERAISYYDLALTGAPDDGVVLAARAAAHAGAGRAEPAEADWARVVDHHPRLRPLAFGSLALAGRFAAAARVGDLLVAQNPRNVDEWLRAATAHALAGDKAAYGEFMGRMMRQFEASAGQESPFGWVVADAYCRAGALLPDEAVLSRLPSDAQARSLDAGLVGGSRAVWGGPRAPSSPVAAETRRRPCGTWRARGWT